MRVSGDIVGRAVNAVLVPPQAERFASVAGADLDRLVLNVTGWNKLVLLDSDRVFLFPRGVDGPATITRQADHADGTGATFWLLAKVLG